MPGPAATVGSMHICPMCNPGTPPPPHVGGPVSGPGIPTVLIGGKPAAVMGDMCTCAGPPDTIVQGEGTVLIGGKPAVTIGSMTAHGGSVTVGDPTVLIGTGGSGKTTVMAVHKIPFPKIDFKLKALAAISGRKKKLDEAIEKQNIVREQAPVEEVPEDSTNVTLSTNFAKEQLIYLTKNNPEPLFMALFIKTFGMDIPMEAFEELYADVQNNATILNAPLTVKKEIPFGGRQATFYSNNEEGVHEIFVAEKVIIDSAKPENSELRGELMTMLVEEYGHYLDYLLRHHYAQTIKTDAKHDDGAKYTYNLYSINPIEQKDQHFATATIDGVESQLIWDFSELHNDLKKHVNKDRQNQDDTIGNYEFYKAGSLNPNHSEYGHADIEKEALIEKLTDYIDLGLLKDNKEVLKILDKIYLGNWLRDFSQAADPMIVRPMANGLDTGAKLSDDVLDKNKSIDQAIKNEVPENALEKDITLKDKATITYPTGVKDADDSWLGIDIQFTTGVKDFQPVKTSVDFIATAIEMAAAKEFINKPDKKGNPTKYKDTDDFGIILEKFRTEFKQIDIDVLGVYRPEEHIDNPLGLGHADDKGTDRKDDQLHPKFLGYVANNSKLHNIGGLGMKNYIRGNEKSYATKSTGGKSVMTAYEYIRTKLISAAGGGFKDVDSLVDLGAALHTLEDYFAHSNYAEICLIKKHQPAVFPWVDKVKKTGFAYSYSDILENKKIASKYFLFPESELRGVTNKLAACLPLVTGTFGKVDTAASVLPIVNEHILGIEIEPWVKTEPGERTFADIMMLEMAKDFDNNGSKKEFELASYLKSAFKIRDFLVTVKNMSGDTVQKALHFLSSYIGMLFNFMGYFTASAGISTLNDAQIALNKDLDVMASGSFSIGIDPSHTQVAKDDTAQPLHDLSSQLAIYAVKHIGGAIFDAWQSGSKNANKALELLDICMRHPAVSDWQDGIVDSWAIKNKQKVCEACSPSIVVERVLHTVEHIEEGLKATDQFVNNTDIIDKLGAFYNSKSDKKVDVKGLKDNINAALANCNNLIVKTKKVKEVWDKKYPKPDNCIALDVGTTKLHIVKKNENLTVIAKMYHTDVATIKALNRKIIIGDDTIQRGIALKVPVNHNINKKSEKHTHNSH